MDVKNEIGLRLKGIRKALKLSQAAFAEDIGVSLPAYQRYETGKRMPSGASLTLVEQALAKYETHDSDAISADFLRKQAQEPDEWGRWVRRQALTLAQAVAVGTYEDHWEVLQLYDVACGVFTHCKGTDQVFDEEVTAFLQLLKTPPNAVAQEAARETAEHAVELTAACLAGRGYDFAMLGLEKVLNDALLVVAAGRWIEYA